MSRESVMQSQLLDEIKKLSVSEKILLVEEIWDGIASSRSASIMNSCVDQSQPEALENEAWRLILCDIYGSGPK